MVVTCYVYLIEFLNLSYQIEALLLHLKLLKYKTASIVFSQYFLNSCWGHDNRNTKKRQLLLQIFNIHSQIWLAPDFIIPNTFKW